MTMMLFWFVTHCGSKHKNTKTNHRNIDKVDETMDEIREQMDLANDVSNAISEPLGDQGLFDEDELDEELNQLEQEELDSTLLQVKSVLCVWNDVY